MSRKTTRAAFWWVTLATLLAVAVTGSLGRWQLGRAADKQAMAAQREARQTLPPLGWEALQAVADSGRWADAIDRPVELHGRWMHEATVFLENRPMQGRPGFFVVTPLQQESGTTTVLVVRGWVPRRIDDRTALPDLPELREPVRVIGRLAPPPSQLYDFGTAGQGRIRQNIDLAAYGDEWSLRLWPVSVQQQSPEGAPDTLLRDWPVVGSDVHKHHGYAFQWFGLASLLLILYVWFQLIAPWRARRAAHARVVPPR
jgi:surfeit locus 1 family protein